MARTAAYTASTLGAGLRRAGSEIGQTLMGIQSSRDVKRAAGEDERRYALDFALRQQEVKQSGDNQRAMRELQERQQAASERARAEAAEMARQDRVAAALTEQTKGRSGGYPNARIVVPEVSITGDALTPGRALMMQGGGAPYVDYGDYDLNADPEWQRERARIEAQGSQRLREIGASGDVQRGLVEARGTGGGRTGGPDIRTLPVGVQNALVAGDATQAALDNYGQIVREYMGKGPVSRFGSAIGIPGQNDEDVGRIEAAQRTFMLNAKELANLGVLNGPDMGILTDIIGDPLTIKSAMWSPQYTLAKLSQAQQFITDRVGAYEGKYGMLPSVPQREPGIPVNAGEPVGGSALPSINDDEYWRSLGSVP